MPQLIHVCDSEPGILRKRHGRGFVYADARKRRPGAKVLARIRTLAIPPAWTNVWICANPRGHLQATGRDARGRKQYRYHDDWRRARDADKFDNIIEFGKRLPFLRRALRRDLARRGLPREKVLAVAVSLLACAEIRIGNEEYTRSNGSYGLTTLRDRHLTFLRAGRARFRFRGKGGQMHEVRVDDGRLVRLLRRCQQLPGQMLFQYVDDEGNQQCIDSTIVNEYLQGTMGKQFTAKDFRTWTGTQIAIARLATEPCPGNERALNSAFLQVVDEVAAHLRNTRSVCRKSYIDPCVLDAWRNARIARYVDATVIRFPRKFEIATLKLLRAERRKR